MALAQPLRFALAGMAGLAAAMGIGRFVYTAILPAMMHEAGLSAADSGFVASANFAGYLAGAVTAGGAWAAGRERAVAIAAITASTLLAGAMAIADSVAWFATVRFLAGFASAWALVLVMALVLDGLARTDRADLQPVFFAGVGLGIALSAAMTGALLVTGTGWRAGWIWAALISAVGLAAFAWLLPVTARRAGAAPERSPSLSLTPPLLRATLAYGLFGFGYIVTMTFLVAITRAAGETRLFETLAWLVTGVAAILSGWLVAPLVRRVGWPVTFAIACVVEAAGVLASVLVPGAAGPLLGGLMVGITFMVITSAGLQLGIATAPASRRRIVALMTVGFSVGQIAGPLVGGLVAERTGSFVVPSAIGAAALVAAALIALVDRRPLNSP